MASRSTTPWWVNGGEERCAFCAQKYAFEVAYRCSSCDSSVCPHCVVVIRVRKEAYCPSCPPGGE